VSKSTDERGRLYLPKGVRDRFGERFRIVELPTHVALFPVDDDPVEGLRDAVGDAFADADADDLKAAARERVASDARDELADDSDDDEDKGREA
jgi:bifunctional DNA-binding transcriptional regulator/antitoxin component of YhaV-PrlF toxin-antitoxin module